MKPNRDPWIPGPRGWPVSLVRVDPDFAVYVANLAAYHKTSEIAANPKVELGYLASGYDQLWISGRAEVGTDELTLAKI